MENRSRLLYELMKSLDHCCHDHKVVGQVKGLTFSMMESLGYQDNLVAFYYVICIFFQTKNSTIFWARMGGTSSQVLLSKVFASKHPSLLPTLSQLIPSRQKQVLSKVQHREGVENVGWLPWVVDHFEWRCTCPIWILWLVDYEMSGLSDQEQNFKPKWF